MSLNRVTLLGRLGQDPEVKVMQNGNSVCNMTVATSEKWKGKDNNQVQEKTEWHRVVVYGNTAIACGQYLHKGSQVLIEGKLQTRSWDDKDGIKRFATEVIGLGVQFIDPVEKKETQPVRPPAPPAQEQPQPPMYGQYSNDDIPF